MLAPRKERDVSPTLEALGKHCMNHKPKIVIYLYNRLFDPLMQSNFWLYITDYLNSPDNPYQFHLVTYEDPRHPLKPHEEELAQSWIDRGLKWTQLTWHPGRGLRRKALDVLAGFLATAKLRTQGYKAIVSLGSVAGSFAYLYGQVLGIRLFLYQYEPHSEYARDNKMWPPGSLQFKLAHSLERRSAEFATVVASGTRFMRDRLTEDWKVKAKFIKIPTVANDQKFLFDQKLRDLTRIELGIDKKKVLLYPGKFGDLYYREEFAWMYRWLSEEIDNLHMLIVTPHQDDEVHALFQAAGVKNSEYTIQHCDFKDIHKYYFSADMGIISVPPGPSKCFISNIKVGEYLCAGLPFLITEGVSEDYLYATEKKVGVVVKDFKEKYVRQAAEEVEHYLTLEPEARRAHCREVGLEYRGFKALNPRFKEALETLTCST
jgi:hypothetical protein